MGRFLQGMDALLDLRKQAVGDMLGEHDLARGRNRVRSGSHLCEWEGRMYRSNWSGREYGEYSLYFKVGYGGGALKEILGRKRLLAYR